MKETVGPQESLREPGGVETGASSAETEDHSGAVRLKGTPRRKRRGRVSRDAKNQRYGYPYVSMQQ